MLGIKVEETEVVNVSAEDENNIFMNPNVVEEEKENEITEEVVVENDIAL